MVSQQPLGLEIEGDDNILPLITTDISGGVMHIKSKRSFSVNQPIVLKISTPNLEGISASGAGSVEVSDLKNDKFEIDANGAPSIKVSGVTGTINIEANGAGKIDAHKLRADKGTVEANGVAKIEVFARDELKVTVSGPASVIYRGDPNWKDTQWSGSIERKESEGS